jgi:8-oxo-dGTP diphosphatase
MPPKVGYGQPMGEWVEPQVWYAQLPAFYAAAAALLTDPAGRVLLVKPNYRPHWALPGGYVDADEFPHQAASREISEELGLQLTVGPLLVVDWAPPAEQRPRAIINFIFDGGTIDGPESIQMRTEELDEFDFLTPTDCATRLPGMIAPRIPAALAARTAGQTAYLCAGANANRDDRVTPYQQRR